MAVKTLRIDAGRWILVDSRANNKRACLMFSAASVDVVDDKCPHRGGPLHLGAKALDGRTVCPWHGRLVKESACTDFAVVFHPRAGRAVIVSDYPDGVLWPIKVLPVSSGGVPTPQGRSPLDIEHKIRIDRIPVSNLSSG